MKLENKVAVITGGNSGIGLGIAREFAKQDASIVIFGRSAQSLESATAEIGSKTLAVQGDVTNISDLDHLFETTVERFSKIDVLVVNAGVACPVPVDQIDEDAFDFLSDINFKGAFFTVQRALPYLNDGASIILNSSVANSIGLPGMAVCTVLPKLLCAHLRAHSGQRFEALKKEVTST